MRGATNLGQAHRETVKNVKNAVSLIRGSKKKDLVSCVCVCV